MEPKELIGKTIKDTKNDYSGDIGVITDIRHFEKADKTYAVVQWGENSKHGNGVYRNYAPKEFGILKRFKIVE